MFMWRTKNVSEEKCLNLMLASHGNRWPCNSYVFKIYQKHLFLWDKTKKIENNCIGFFSSKKTVTIKWLLSENLAFQNLLKKRKLLPDEKFWNILAFDKKSKRKSNQLYLLTVLLNFIYDFRVEISFMPK